MRLLRRRGGTAGEGNHRARQVMEDEDLRITGFPGVVGRAGLDGLLTRSDIRRLLTLCQRQGTHYSNRLIEHVAEKYGR